MKVTLLKNKKRAVEVVDVHMQSFAGFFLTFLGKGFLKQLYQGFMEHNRSGILAAVGRNDRIVGFLAYSEDLSGFYQYLIKKHLLTFSWYAFLGFVRNPKICFRLFRAFFYSREAKRQEAYIELASLGVLPDMEGMGVGSRLIENLKRRAEGGKYQYIKLETDSENNDRVNRFYVKNGFVLDHSYLTREGRKMNEYRFRIQTEAFR